MSHLLDPRVEAIFDAVADLPAGERERVLAERCGGDEALRRRVEALLACNTPSGVQGAVSLHEAPGTRIGPYEIVAPLGEGGMGTVYLAVQHEPIQRRVALKIIKLGMDTRRVIARFEMERQVLALLDHPNIARVFDAGATDRGRPYFVMELVEGEPLTNFCDARCLDVRARLRLFLAVCRAVRHAHQRGIIHRDLKPTNVLVAAVEGEPVPKVIDFGVAKATRPEMDGISALTEHHQVIGTPEYMSPEQAGLGDGEVDTRSDIYSLGVLLYELLTGVTPHGRTDAAAVREGAAPTPSRRIETLADRIESIAQARACTPRALRKHLRDGLDWIALKCLEKEKERRYESAAALAHDVEAYLADAPLAAGPPDLGYRVRTFLRRHRRALGIGAVVAAAFVVLIAGFLKALLDKAEEERAARQIAEAALHANRIERGRLLGMTGNLSLAEELVWGLVLEQPSAAARWALWEIYWRQPCLATRDVDGGFIDAIDFHPGGSVFATGQATGLVRLWNADGLHCSATFEAHAGEVRAVAFSPDGSVLASAALDGTIVVRDAAGGAVTRVLRADAGFWCLGFSPDGRLLASGDEEGALRVWEAATGRLVATVAGAGRPRRALLFDPDGSTLVSARDDGVIDLFAIGADGSLRPTHELTGHTSWVMALALAPDGRTLYSGGTDRSVRRWDLRSRTCLSVLEPGIGSLRALAPAPGGSVFLLSNRAAERWTADFQERLATVRVPASSTMAVHGDLFCIVGAGVHPNAPTTGRVRLFEIEPGRAVRKVHAHAGGAYALAVTPGGLVTAGADRKVRLGERVLGEHADEVRAAGVTLDGRTLCTASVDGEVRLWDLATGSMRVKMTGFNNAGTPLDVSPAGDRVATAEKGGTVRVWAVPSGEPIGAHRVSSAEVTALAFHPAGALIATAAQDHTVRLWDARTFEPAGTLPHDVTPVCVAFSPDGAMLAAGTMGQRVHLWDVASRTQAGVLRGHHGLVRDLAFAPPALRTALGIRGLVSASDDGTLKLWDLDTQACVLTLPGDEPAYSVAFLDGPRLASTHGRGTLAIWDLSYYDRHIEGNRAHQERLQAHR